MPLSLRCSCGRLLIIADEHAGRRARCPSCGEIVPLPEPSGDFIPEEERPRRAGARSHDAEEEWDPEIRRKPMSGSLLPWLALLFLLLAGSGVLVWYLLRSVSPNPLDNSPLVHQEGPPEQENVLRLRILAKAMRQYHGGILPPAAHRDRDGKPLLSWRVLVLLDLEEFALANEFHMMESWDSPHNLKLLGRMPRVFALPGQDPREGKTCYQVFTGRKAPFIEVRREGGAFPFRGPILQMEFPDGPANTLLIAEAAQAVPWTRPEDIPYTPLRPMLPKLGGHFGNRFAAVTANGDAYLISRDISEQTLKAAITPSAGDRLGPDWPAPVEFADPFADFVGNR